MLYKKYHRSYVRQFKKGAKFMWNRCAVETVMKEPYICNGFIFMKDSKYSCWDLVYSRAEINKYLYVVQEIS